MNKKKVLEIAHRTAWKFKHSSDPSHSSTYTFNESTLIDFVNKIHEARSESIEIELPGDGMTAYEEGKLAAALDDDFIDNPYRLETAEHDEWIRGYFDIVFGNCVMSA